MELVINERYRISSDAYNYIVEERKIAGKDAPEPGKEYWVNNSYHRTLRQACEWLLNANVKESDVADGFIIVRELDILSEQIKRAIDESGLLKSLA